jgi:molybdenum-dependent DNA-binding transcriptional regulator ModE
MLEIRATIEQPACCVHEHFELSSTTGRSSVCAMKLHQFEALVAVVDHGGIRAAARALHVSQAAVTKSMRLLEEEAGTPLLIRRTRGVALTEAGQRLLARARVITRQVDLAREDLRQAGGDDAGTLRVGLTPYLNFTALGETFGWFRQRYRHVALQFIEGLTKRACCPACATAPWTSRPWPPTWARSKATNSSPGACRACRNASSCGQATRCWPIRRRAR